MKVPRLERSPVMVMVLAVESIVAVAVVVSRRFGVAFSISSVMRSALKFSVLPAQE